MKNVLVPELSESVAEAVLLGWRVAPGDVVREGDVLVEVETDKITMEVYAVCDGVVRRVHLAEGAEVKGGDLLAEIEEGVGAGGEVVEAGGEVVGAAGAAPSARKIAEEQGVDLEEVSGSGRGGRITKGDVLAVVEEAGGEGGDSAASADSSDSSDSSGSVASVDSSADSSDSVPVAAPAAGVVAAAAPEGRAVRRAPMSRARARIAERLMESQHGTATLTTFNEVNMQAVMDLRAAHREEFLERHGVKLGFMAFFVKAAVAGLRAFPIINASVDGKDVVYHEYYDVGVAVAARRGLVVPVLRDADAMSMAAVEQAIGDFGARAQTGALTLEELSGGTFSVTNGGVFGSMLSTPIINPPQSAILGVHATRMRAVVEDGAVVARPVCYLALSYDHRIIDGREAVLFLVAVKKALEAPARLLLDL